IVDIFAAVLWCGVMFIAGCAETPAPQGDPSPWRESVIRIDPGPDASKRAQAAMINAHPGDIIELGAGRFICRATLSLDVSHVTIRGQGPGRTILSFKDQGPGTGGEGLLVTSKEDVALEDLAVEDAQGDAIKIQGTRRIVFRNIRAEWTEGPKASNGSY